MRVTGLTARPELNGIYMSVPTVISHYYILSETRKRQPRPQAASLYCIQYSTTFGQRDYTQYRILIYIITVYKAYEVEYTLLRNVTPRKIAIGITVIQIGQTVRDVSIIFVPS